MDEITTTDAVTQDSGAIAQPDEQQAEAVQDTSSETQSTDSTDDSASTDTSTDSAEEADTSDINTWLSKKGIDPTSPEALTKIADMARNSERAMHKSAQERAEAQRQLTSNFKNQADPTDANAWMQGQVQELKLKDMARDFVDRHPDVKDDLGGMSEYLQTNKDIQTLTEAGILTLDQVHAMYMNSPAQADKLREQGGQAALQKLANKQRASAVQGNASSQGTKSAGNSIAELESRLSDIKF